MVKQDAVDGEHAVGFPVFLGNPEAVLLGNGVGGIGVERRGLPLGNLLHLAEQLRGRGLIEFGLLGQAQNPAGFQNPQHAQGVHIAGVFRHVEADLHMALGRQIVDFVGLNEGNNPNQGRRIRQIAVMELDLAHQVIDSRSIGNGSPAGDAVDFIALFQQKLRKVGTVLTGDTGD